MLKGPAFIFQWAATFLNKKGDITHSEEGMAFGRLESMDQLGYYLMNAYGRKKDKGIGYSAVQLHCTDEVLDEEE